MDTLLRSDPPRTGVRGGLVDIDGETYYRITGYDTLAPFLMSLASDSDHWLFISSTGALTAGRRSPDHALFPYYTDDRIHDSRADTGSRTIMRVDGTRWEPFGPRHHDVHRVSRDLYKSTVGNKVRFEEINHDLALTFAYEWTTSERFGFVRRAALTNHADRPVEVEILDGIENLLPAGVDRAFQEHYSTLVDGYKDNELDPATGLALMRLSSLPTDAAEPREALRATTVWSRGLDPAVRLLSAVQLDRFRDGRAVTEEARIRGRRGAYFLRTRMTLGAGEARRWIIVADVERDAADVVATRRLLRSGGDPLTEVDADVLRGTDALVGIVASADGLQVTGDELSAARHFSNTLFNVMRGGVPADGYTVSRADFGSYLRGRHPDFAGALPETLPHAALLGEAARRADPELERLVREYLPLTFSRRHGDPSRPWNNFTIAVKDDQGRRILGYEGNWRDIFQNWEALAHSHPSYVESMVCRFVNASTADGGNPYRLTRDGFEWEVLDPSDPWSHVGYWGDHQVIYLLRLLEAAGRFHPGAIEGLLTRRLFTYAEVPYRIRPYPALLEDPRHTIDFDTGLHRELAQREPFLRGPDGARLRVNLAEKLLVVALTKLGNYIPGAGIWLNTQRPEWNDANNALVGYGVSVVTLCYLRRFLAYCRTLFDVPVELSAEVATLFRRISHVLASAEHLLGQPMSDADRKSVLDGVGAAASDYRRAVYAGLSGDRVNVAAAELRAFCKVALRHVDESIRANRRPDGLYHAYNLMRVEGAGISVRHLYEMLEGQVAALSSGVLDVAESAVLLDALRMSALYRPDQNSYLLYPDRRLPRFLDRNIVPASALRRSPLLAGMVRRGDRRLVVQDVEGGLHFNAAFRNASDLRVALVDVPPADASVILDLYETVFDHRSFTGRSGTFYKYEGLGCIYWHMVSKLLVAVQEVLAGSDREGDGDAVTVARIRAHYEAIRDGIGVHKSPEVHGAIPTDPYSHTPGFAGAQQPGMTGQVKEDIIARYAELGLTVSAGRLRFRPDLVRTVEFLGAPRAFHFYDVRCVARSLDLPAGTLGLTFCQVPVVVHRSGPARIVVSGGAVVEGLTLDASTSAAVFARTGEVGRLDVYVGLPSPSSASI